MALLIYFLIYFTFAFIWRSVLVYRRTGKNPFVLPSGDDAYGYVGRRIWLEFHFVSPTGRNGRRTECDGRSRGLKPTETSRPSREPALPDRGVQTGSKRSGRVGDLPAESQARSIRELDAPREAAKRI